ncbi:MAG: hypothetical protein COY39_04605 [Alphaproteobacteria bacterium CG_4_10_14_0_8_um_filter_37_21]|nr:MAG: hypothetical protein COY39_04605 [Alphaproteobacteria bacterium CG_4_10_14_0_8_um_filter_37_21]
MLNVRNLYDSRIKNSTTNPISFQIKPGESLAVKGTNGVGKTTLLRLITNIITPPDDTEVIMTEAHQYLGAKNGLFQNLKIHHYLKEAKGVFSKKDLNKNICDLSTGMQRQLALSCLYQQHKDLWIIDEPTAHLDEAAKNLFYKNLELHVATGGSALIATHDRTPCTIRILNIGSERTA